MTKSLNDQQPPMAATDPLEALLTKHLSQLPESVDDGFAEQLIAQLPATRGAIQHRQLLIKRYVIWVSISVASCTAASLLAATGGRIDGPHGMAALALIVLLAFWSWPTMRYRK